MSARAQPPESSTASHRRPLPKKVSKNICPFIRNDPRKGTHLLEVGGDEGRGGVVTKSPPTATTKHPRGAEDEEAYEHGCRQKTEDCACAQQSGLRRHIDV